MILLDPSDVEGVEDVLRINRSREKHYAFDYVFDQATGQVIHYHTNNRKKYLSSQPND